jgi:hypothetical protein
MKRFAFLCLVFSMLTGGASAQTMQTTISGDEHGVQMIGPNEGQTTDASEKRKAYEKKVGGIVWLEATAGPSRFDVTRFRSLDIIPEGVQQSIPSLVVAGPEFGAALKFRAGSSTIGARFKRADYEPFDLTSVGLDLGFLIRAVPYVHPSIKMAFSYYRTSGGLGLAVPPGLPVDVALPDARSQGGGASIGAGLRIPVVRWISIAADFEYSIIGLVFRGDASVNGTSRSITAGTAGTAIAGTFALTFHLGG